MFFDGWAGPLRTVVVGACAYVMLVLFLRISGKRTLSKMNAFDLVVTVALGSTLATVLLDRSVPLIEGITAFALLIGAQFLITWTSIRSERVRRLVKSNPRAVLEGGQFLEGPLRRERLTHDEVEAAIRQSGHAEAADIEQVVLETDGALSVVPRSKDAG